MYAAQAILEANVNSALPGERDMGTGCLRWNGGNTAALPTTVSTLTTRDVTKLLSRMNGLSAAGCYLASPQ
jgi:hypothetical protein